MDKPIRKTMELRRAVFIKNDRIYFLDIPITEFLSFLPFHPFILAEQKIRRITGRPLPGEFISQFLDLHICDAVVLKFDHDIHDNKGIFICDPRGIIWQHLQDLYPLPKDQGEQFFQPFRCCFRVHDLFKKCIIQDPDPLCPSAAVEKFFLLLIIPFHPDRPQFFTFRDLSEDRLPGTDLRETLLQYICHTHFLLCAWYIK